MIARGRISNNIEVDGKILREVHLLREQNSTLHRQCEIMLATLTRAQAEGTRMVEEIRNLKAKLDRFRTKSRSRKR